MNTNQNLRRSLKYVKDMARRRNLLNLLPMIHKMIAVLHKMCGEGSRGRKNMNAVGRALSNTDPKIIVPLCLDYSGVDLDDGLVKAHVKFLLKFWEQSQNQALHPVKAVLLVPHCDASDNFLAQLYGAEHVKSKVQHLEKVALKSRSDTIEVSSFDALWPSWDEYQKKSETLIHSSDLIKSRMSYVADRHKVLQRFSAGYRMLRMTSMSKGYISLALATKESGNLILTHTTPNILWYKLLQAPVLHNPVDLNGNKI